MPIEDQVRWNKCLPIKINVHTWRLFRDRLPTRYNLDIRGIDLHSSLCPVCDEHIETSKHLFIDCSIASQLWKLVCYWWGFHDYPKDVCGLITWADSVDLNGSAKIWFDVVVQSTTWIILRYRNKICFDSKPPRKDTLGDDIMILSHSWISHKSKLSCPKWLDWIVNPKVVCTNHL